MSRMELPAVHVWDGRDDLGVRRLEWSLDDVDGTVDQLAPVAADAEFSVVPGLIDTHVHLIGNASSTPADFLAWPLVTRTEEQVLHGLSHARRALAAGVTTLRDLAADDVQFSLKRALDAGVVEGPRLLAHGVVNMTGGHADLFIPPAVAQRKPVADGPDACRALVRHWARAGSDGIKVPVSGGVLSDGDKAAWRNYTDAEIAAIVDEAHAFGMPVAAHAHTEAGIRAALRHGVDSIEHATQLTPELAAEVVAAGIAVAPTLLINDRIARGGGTISAAQQAKAAGLVAQRDGWFRTAADAGVEFVLGTDANGHHVVFGDQMEEVRQMAAVFGWTASRALEAATSRAAHVIGRPDLGVVGAGAPADFLVMRGQPWRDIDQLRTENIVAVVSRGRVVAGSLPA